MILDLAVRPVERDPFPHIVRDGFIRADVYEELRRTFPECPPSSGPSRHGLFWGDAAYDELMAKSAAWKSFFDEVQSQAFIDYVIAQFDGAIRAECLVDLSRARHLAWKENREDKERDHLVPSHAPDELFVRLDVHQGHTGYDRGIHVDHRRRLMSMLIYFCDTDEAHMIGGNLVLEPSAVGWPPWRKKVVDVRHNRMAAFACGPTSWHAVPRMIFARQNRNYVQIQVSSTHDLWGSVAETAAEGMYRRIGEALPVRAARRAVTEIRKTVAALRHS